MTNYVFKRPGSKLYTGRYRLKEDAKITQVALGCSNLQVAEKKLREMVEEKEREAAGIIAPKVQREAAHKLLKGHLEDWIATKEQVRDDQYLVGVRNRIARLVKECGWAYAKDVKAEDYVLWMSGSKLSPKTINDFLISARTLLNWMVKRGRITFNPLRSVDLLPTNGEKRRPRRALSDEEFAKLVNESGDRGTVYLVVATTGLRFGEMMEVERGDVRLDDGPKIVARAATTKNRKEASLPLHEEVGEQLRTFLAAREIAPTEKVFAPLFRKRGQFKRDLEAADIPSLDASGRVVDFHSLRYTFCTNIQRLGTPQRVLMHLMRHSDRRLSDHVYTDTSLLPANETVQRLTVPRKFPSHIASHDLVPAGQNGSHVVTAAKMVECPGMPMNTGFRHDQTFPVTPGRNGGMVRDTGFEYAIRTMVFDKILLWVSNG